MMLKALKCTSGILLQNPRYELLTAAEQRTSLFCGSAVWFLELMGEADGRRLTHTQQGTGFL